MMELVCPAGTPAALRAAVEAGAHAVYCGFADETNARNFPGLNFTPEDMAEAVRFAHARGAKVLVAINTFPRAGAEPVWHRALANTEAARADAVILADIGLLAHAAEHHPSLRRHLSVQAAAANPDAINLYASAFGVRRVVLPRVLTVQEIAAINREIDVETEVFVFGGLCVMAEGRCSLSSYATVQSPNTAGVCSPAAAVRWQEGADGVRARLGGVLIDHYAPDEPRGYPTLCKGRFDVDGQRSHALEEPTSLNTMAILPQLIAMGVRAFKIEGRQRSAAYVGDVTRTWRAAIDAACAAAAQSQAFQPLPAWTQALSRHAEGAQTTLGAFERPWR